MSLKAAQLLGYNPTKSGISDASLVNMHVFLNSGLSGNITQQDINNAGAVLLANNPGLSLTGPPGGINSTCQ